MPSKNPAQRLLDILDNIDAIASFTAGFDFPAVAADGRTVYAVTRALEIISESSRRLPERIKVRHPEIDWIAIASAGNMKLLKIFSSGIQCGTNLRRYARSR